MTSVLSRKREPDTADPATSGSDLPPERLQVLASRGVRGLRHPWQWIVTALVIVLVLNFGQTLFTNKAWEWDRVAHWVFSPAVLDGLVLTLEATALAAVVSFVGGVVVALMRDSRNPVLKSVAWFYVWVFRSVPLILVLLFLYNLGNLYPTIGIGIPFGPQFQIPTAVYLSDLTLGVIGLNLSEIAYSSEVVRSGLLAVDRGQHEAAKALGIPRGRQFTRIVLPQALRSIIPSYVNQIVGLIKASSLLFYVSLLDLFGVVQNLSSTYPTDVIPLYVVATIWYLILTSAISIVQYFVERYYGRGLRGAR